MDAPQLLQNLRDRGMHMTPLPGGRLKVAPARALTETDREAIRQHRSDLLALLTPGPRAVPNEQHCGTCAHRTPAQTCAEPVAAGLAPKFRIVFVPALQASDTACPAWRNTGDHHRIAWTITPCTKGE